MAFVIAQFGMSERQACKLLEWIERVIAIGRSRNATRSCARS